MKKFVNVQVLNHCKYLNLIFLMQVVVSLLKLVSVNMIEVLFDS